MSCLQYSYTATQLTPCIYDTLANCTIWDKDKYSDFGPTLASEQLSIRDGLVVNSSTLRLWLLDEGLWIKKRRRKQHRNWREPREHSGELIQMDGSHHDWFEGRADKCVLMVLVDDANKRTYARFYESENTSAAFDILHRYIKKYGIPLALYPDKDSIYKTSREANIDEQLRASQPLTQFERGCERLNIKLILANYTIWAKGRVERKNQVFQDRLVKLLRLENISNIKDANRFLDNGYMEEHNNKFMCKPLKEEDLHMKIPEYIKLEEILCFEDKRVVMADWTLRWKNRFFQITKRSEALGLVKQKITVREQLNGKIQLVYKGHNLAFKEIPNRPVKTARKPLSTHTARKPYKPSPLHPWRKLFVKQAYLQPQLDSDESWNTHSRRVSAETVTLTTN